MWYVFSRHNYLQQINESSAFKRVWESIALPQPQNADSTWNDVFFPLMDPFFFLPLLERKF